MELLSREIQAIGLLPTAEQRIRIGALAPRLDALTSSMQTSLDSMETFGRSLKPCADRLRRR